MKMTKENIKKLFTEVFNWKLPETKEEEYKDKYHYHDILMVIKEMEQINLSLGNVINQRELLIAFYKHLKGNYNTEKMNLIIDHFYESN